MKKSKRNRDKNNNKNVRLGLYFGLVVIFIIIISFTFKVFDSIKKSTFDGNNFYSVAIFSGDDTQVISVSPKEGNLKKITLKGVNSENSLISLGVPYDSLAETQKEGSIAPKSFFTKTLLHQDSLVSELTSIDLIKLAIYSGKVSGSNISEESISVGEENSEKLLFDWFSDPEIENEDLKIEIINTTDVSGLGNKMADIITNSGGNVVLVHSAQDSIEKSIITYSEDSYTVGRISRLLDIPSDKKELNSVSDIVIQIGEDRRDF